MLMPVKNHTNEAPKMEMSMQVDPDIWKKNHDQLISTEINTMGCRKPDGRSRLQYNKLSDQEHQTHPVQKGNHNIYINDCRL